MKNNNINNSKIEKNKGEANAVSVNDETVYSIISEYSKPAQKR